MGILQHQLGYSLGDKRKSKGEGRNFGCKSKFSVEMDIGNFRHPPNSAYTNRIIKYRSKTVEPVFGTLVNFVNLSRIDSRGLAQANKLAEWPH